MTWYRPTTKDWPSNSESDHADQHRKYVQRPLSFPSFFVVTIQKDTHMPKIRSFFVVTIQKDTHILKIPSFFVVTIQKDTHMLKIPSYFVVTIQKDTHMPKIPSFLQWPFRNCPHHRIKCFTSYVKYFTKWDHW